jgi:NAD(P)-dependent dehydrogenase (short-subunit alcohol dehydrogenase family)
MDFTLKGRVAVVTGAARGNGAAIAAGLAQAGSRVALLDLLEAEVTSKARELSAGGADAMSRGVDITDNGAVQAAASEIVAALGPVDILVNNAGVLLRCPITSDEAPDAWRKTFAVNVDGTYNMIRAFLPSLGETHGCIVNIGSIQSFVGMPKSAAYAASKGAIAQLTRTLAIELAPMGIRVNAIAPGIIDTEMARESLADPDRIQPFMAHLPLKRVGRPEELVGPVVFLSSEAASYVTGAVLPVDGGYLTV